MRATSSQQRDDFALRERPAAGGRGPLIDVDARCGSIEGFVEKFAAYAFEGALVLPAAAELPIGTEGRFVIRLEDQSVAMRGRCRVTEVRPAPPSPDGTARALLRVALLEMEEGSTSVHRRLLARRRATGPATIAPTAADPAPRARSRTNPLGIPRDVARLASSAAAHRPTPGAALPLTLPADPPGALGADDPASSVDWGADTERDEVVVASPVPFDRPTPEPARPRSVRRLAPYILCAALGVWFGRAGGRTSHQATGWGQTTTTGAAAVAPLRPPSTEGSTRPTVLRPGLVETTPPGKPTGCLARITTEPADAKVFWRNILLGRSPLAAAEIPCGAGSFSLVHDRYETLTLPATVEPGTPFQLDQRLHRPPAVLMVRSSPAGAAITVNGRAFGLAPQRLDTWRYEQVTVRAALPGFLPWTKKLYLAQATTDLAIEMTAAGPPEASDQTAKR